MRRIFEASTFAKLALLFTAVIAALFGAGALGWNQVSGEVNGRAKAEAERAVAAVSASLAQADKVLGPLARAEAGALKAKLAKQGPASLLSAPETGGEPTLKFGSEAVNGGTALVDEVAARLGGGATILAASGEGFVPVATSLIRDDGSRLLDARLGQETEAFANLRAGRPYAGPVEAATEIGGRRYYAHFEPVFDRSGKVVGALGAEYPLEDVDATVRALASSPVFAHGFLAVIDRGGRVLFRSATVNPPWLTRHAAALVRALETQVGVGGGEGPAQGGQAMDGYRLSRSAPGSGGLTAVAGVLPADLTVQTLKLVGASLGAFAIVITLALAGAWLMARRMTEALEEARRSRNEAEAARAAAEATGAALRRELGEAAHYVESLLPAPTREGPVAANWLYRPSAGVGGDAFGYDWLDETHFAFYLLDVCGHGVGAALLATTVMNVIRTRTLAGADFRAPDSVLTALNRAFPMDAQNGMYFTLWYGVYDTDARSVSYASAGHHPALLAPTEEPPQLLRGTGVPIGCFEAAKYPVLTAKVPRGARLYVFSDGLFEVEPRDRSEMFTFEEFCNVIMQWRDHHSELGLSCVMETMQAVQGKASFDDDCALVELTFDLGRRIEMAA